MAVEVDAQGLVKEIIRSPEMKRLKIAHEPNWIHVYERMQELSGYKFSQDVDMKLLQKFREDPQNMIDKFVSEFKLRRDMAKEDFL